MNYKLSLQKFGKGFISGGGVALLAILQSNGCNVTDLKVFGLTVLSGVVSGGFHAAWNLYLQSKPQ